MPKSSLTRIEPAGPAHFCLVSDDEGTEAAVREGFPAPHTITRFPLEGVVDEHLQLSEQGHDIVACARTAEAVLVAWRFDMAPVINTLCFHIRRELLAPIIALCDGSQQDVVAAIAAGADDAFTPPLYPPLLHARALAYRRLTQAALQAAQDSAETASGASTFGHHDVLRFGPLSLDRTAHRFFVRDAEAELTPREFALLEYLVENRDALLTRDQILNRVWGINFDTGTNMVDVYMYFLRRKLEAHGITGMIQTVRGRGYRLVQPETVSP